MILQFAFLIIILIICPIYPLGTTAQDRFLDYVIAQPGCNSICGNVDIAYPFGMKDPKCYADEWFEIECRNTTSTGAQTPYLKSLNLEVRHIDVTSSTVDIMNPVFRWNCQGKTDNMRVIDLKGSPFVYSQYDDRFVAVGCNNFAFLRSNGSTVGGCVSICDDNEEVNNDNTNLGSYGCHGRYCCETSLPMYLSEYNATLADLNNKSVSDECSYALIVNGSWLQSYALIVNGDEISLLKNMDYVPAVLEWEILNNSTLKLPSDSNCYYSNITGTSQNKSSGRRCQCKSGFYGDPYISGGCTGSLGFYGEKSRSKKSAIVVTWMDVVNFDGTPIRINRNLNGRVLNSKIHVLAGRAAGCLFTVPSNVQL